MRRLKKVIGNGWTLLCRLIAWNMLKEGRQRGWKIDGGESDYMRHRQGRRSVQVTAKQSMLGEIAVIKIRIRTITGKRSGKLSLDCEPQISQS